MNKPKEPVKTGWWRGSNPRYQGEYEASFSKVQNLLRWWNGSYWSEPYYETDEESHKRKMRRKRANVPVNDMHWRGFMKRPKNPPTYYLQPLE